MISKEEAESLQPGDKVKAYCAKRGRTEEFEVEAVLKQNARMTNGMLFSLETRRSHAIRYTLEEVIKSPEHEGLAAAEAALESILGAPLPPDVAIEIKKAYDKVKGRR